MYNHFLAWENKSSPISFVINYRTRFLYLAFNLSSCETNYWFRTWLHIFLMHSVSCAALYASIFTLFFFFSVRLQTNFGCNENICKVWKSNRHWGKNKTSFQSYLTCPPLIFNVSWQVCFHRMVSQGLFFQVYWSFLKVSIQRCWKYFVITQMFLKKICKGFFFLSFFWYIVMTFK